MRRGSQRGDDDGVGQASQRLPVPYLSPAAAPKAESECASNARSLAQSPPSLIPFP